MTLDETIATLREEIPSAANSDIAILLHAESDHILYSSPGIPSDLSLALRRILAFTPHGKAEELRDLLQKNDPLRRYL
ncbi:hypothetical protein ACWIG4_30245 [Streptomyces sp. NPDC002248]